MSEIIVRAAARAGQPYPSVAATIRLLELEATVPFIARYRKAQTGGMDEVAVREIEKAWKYEADLAARRETILRTIAEQGKLTPELEARICATDDANVLEDLYLPYKPKRKTKATVAREQGLEPLAAELRTLRKGNKDSILRKYINGDICTPKEALQGAQYIIAEETAESPEFRAYARETMRQEGRVKAKKKDTAHKEAHKFDLYEDFDFQIGKLKPHQWLALARGENLNILSVKISADREELALWIERELALDPDLVFYEEYADAIRLGLDRYLEPSIEREVRKLLKEIADKHAVEVFSQNLRNLLLQPPLSGRVVVGLDPGFASGCKVAVVGPQGDYLAGAVIYPVPPRNKIQEAEAVLRQLIDAHDAELVAIGNGTASRETEAFVANFLKKYKYSGVKYLITSEAGASVYSASEAAAQEFPNLDAAERGNISIARRVQDPLAELVKIDPKALGVGLYQHDVDQRLLASELEAVVESCVNEVGVDLNTASAELLARVSGLNIRLARAIVKRRAEIGRFSSREELLAVKGVGPKSYEQAAGFLRIREGAEPLDNTSIHPESYDKVRALARARSTPIRDFKKLHAELAKLRNKEVRKLLQQVELDEPTYELIVQNLARPGRDPREDVPPPILRNDILKLEDLKEGMTLSGTVRNVVDFGAFVDVGLKNDALLHVSKMSRDPRRRVKNPLDVVQVGDVLQVRIEKIELDRERVSLALAARPEDN